MRDERYALVYADLFFIPRLVNVLLQMGYRAEPVMDAEEALQKIQKAPPSLLVLDLNKEEREWRKLIETVKQNPQLKPVFILAFGSHKQTATLDHARALGADLVVTNGMISSQFPELLDQLMAKEEAQADGSSVAELIASTQEEN